MHYLRFLTRPEKIQLILLAIANLSYAIYWSIFSVDRFYSLHAYVLDLGVAMESGWLIFHTHWTLSYFFNNFYYLSGRILLSPLFITGNFTFILVVQTVAISLGSVFVFLIAKRVLRDEILPIFIALSYLIYFPLAGANFFDFHYQVFFIPFFLAGFYYYLRERYIVAIILLTISGLFRFPYMAFPAALFVIEIFTIMARERRNSFKVDGRRLRFLFYGFVTFSFFLILGYASLLSASSGQSTAIINLTHGSFFSLSNIKVNLDIKILTVILILGGLLFLPLKSKYIVLTLPYFFFVFFYDFKGYYYPNALQNQYTAALVPFLFLALIEVLKNYYPFGGKKEAVDRDSGLCRKLKNNALKEVIVILVVLILFTQVYQPYGVLNNYTEDSFGSSYVMNVSVQHFETFEHAINLIPKNTPSNEILVQNDLPFVYPHPANSSSPLSYIQTLTYNNTAFFSNFTELGNDGKYYPVSPKYVVMYPYGSYGPNNRFGYFEYINMVSPPPNNLSNFMIVTHLLATGDYGLIAEADGLFILEKGYKGPLEYYAPFNRYYPYSDFTPGKNSSMTSNGIVINGSSNNPFFYGPPTALVPGNYTVTYYFKMIGANASGLINLRSYYDNGYLYFSNYTVLHNTSSKGSTLSFIYGFSSNGFTAGDQFNAYVESLNGTIIFEGISINQVTAPST